MSDEDEENVTPPPPPPPPPSPPDTASTSSAASEGNNNGRSLRKRRLNLNRLANAITCPQVCKWQFCGVQLRDGDSLEWHYQGHLAKELERLERVSV
jgi:hypothetical protein